MDQIEKLGTFAAGLNCDVRYDEPMSRHTTFQIGGPADLFLTARDLKSLQQLIKKACELEVGLLPLGNGSNMLVSDAGIRGAVLRLDGDFKKVSPVGDTALECGAAASLAHICNIAKDCSLTGMEFAWGIPGLAGGAAYMNAGAYGRSLSEVVTACSHVTKTGEAGVLKGSELGFGYRRSAFQTNGCLITSLRIQLSRGERGKIEAEMSELYGRRKEKQPLELPSAGSVFKRPEGHFAGALIEQCGLKGRRVGGAAVSEKHAGFIVNLGGATCADVQKLIAVIQESVYRETGIRLECEVKSVG